MKENDFYQVFQDLGIQVEPLQENYSPDAFGKNLMASVHFGNGVSYSSYTEVNVASEDRLQVVSN